MKCLLKYQWVKLPRNQLPPGTVMYCPVFLMNTALPISAMWVACGRISGFRPLTGG